MRISYLGGERGKRSLFGQNRKRLIPPVILGAITLIIGVFQLWAFVIGGVLTLLLLLAVSPGITGSLWDRVLKRLRWRWREKQGITTFVPFDPDLWEILTRNVKEARTRRDRKIAERRMHAMRENPDGLDGFWWLQDGQGVPGIQWHRPSEQEPYLAAVMSTSGQVDGVGADNTYDSAAQGFGRLLAGVGDPLTLPTRVQTLVRTLPPDSVRHEAWMESQIDEDVPGSLAVSYKEILDSNSGSTLISRHFLVVTWPLTAAFHRKAASIGEGEAAWIELMMREISRMQAVMRSAGYKDVRPLTARQTAAVIRHMQLPSFPIDRVSDLTPKGGFLPSEDSWHATTYYAASARGGLSQSLVRTARFEVEAIEGSERNALWLDPLMARLGNQIPRTLAFHQELSPQGPARAAAERDITADDADAISRAAEGRLADLETQTALSAALRRRLDLAPGSGNAGAAWVGYLSVSAGDRKQLREACEEMQAAASNAGLGPLTWMDTQQSTAAAFTWPCGRGILPARTSRSDQVFTGLEAFAAEEML